MIATSTSQEAIQKHKDKTRQAEDKIEEQRQAADMLNKEAIRLREEAQGNQREAERKTSQVKFR